MVTRFLLLLGLLLGTVSYAGESIDDYRIELSLHQNGSLDVAERIRYNFGGEIRHGIFRDIPLALKTKESSAARLDIGLEKIDVLADNRKVPFEVTNFRSNGGGKVRVRIGDPARYVTGTHLYRIAYGVKRGVTMEGSDYVLRWNAVGTEWNIPIHVATATVHLPQALSQANVKLAVFTGRYGSTASKATQQWVDDRTLLVSMTGLGAHEALTVEAAFARSLLGDIPYLMHPEPVRPQLKRAVKHKYKIPAYEAQAFILTMISWGVAALLWLLMHWYWYVYGRNVLNRSIPVQYAAPKGFGVLESGILFNRFSAGRHFAAAIVDLARQGYLGISRDHKGVFLEKSDVPGKKHTPFQERLYQLLFFRGKRFDISKPPRGRMGVFLGGIGRLKRDLSAWTENDGYMLEGPRYARKAFLVIFGILCGIFTAVAMFFSFLYVGDEVTMIVFILGGFGVYLLTRAALAGVLFVFFSAISIYVIFSEGGSVLPYVTHTPFLALIVVFLLLLVYYRNMGKYTEKGLEVYARLLGYKEFIKRVELDEIRRRQEEDPAFLSQALPYAMLFGYEKKWIGFFKSLETDIHDWHREEPALVLSAFSSSASLMESSFGGGGSSGGSGGGASGSSSSGGGSGGGGGGSW
ncbi:DUF2207 domain-containing protein [Sulfurimonas sp. HSL-3221]|uniref:DUF2207 domain-containing protein n=1 Tax=Sulfurimonadaceae TaxID=2771471 RepID=UPI001E3A9DAA|nr:DUF2207 domain-containing protein [Sulfurimonas sp. HSL-3221]UFS63189.1 DUF2207 domain-containing protein [Sulfurimonas sp. HSL-3221]